MPKVVRTEFIGHAGNRLAARLDLPDASPRAYALFAHCFTCTKHSIAATRIAAALGARGIAVLRFDFTGLGGSEGEFANTDFSSNVEDLVRAADYLRDTYEAPAILIGHSLGGAAVLAAAARIPPVRAVATIGAPAEPAHVLQLGGPNGPLFDERGEAELALGGRRFRISRRFVEDIERQRQAETIAALRKPLLILHAPRDAVVGIDNAGAIFRAAKHPKSFVSLDDADHLLTRREDASYAAGVIAAWAERYLPAGEPEPEADTEGTVLVRETGRGRFEQEIRVGPHRILADEPLAAGGGGAGPTPYDLLLAALGACTSMTIRMYADRKGWPLERAAVHLRHAKIHAEDCADCETEHGMVDRIWKEIELAGPLDETQRARLLEIAERCPVNRSLHAEIGVVGSLRA